MQETEIIVDNRERNLEIIEGLENNKINVTFAQLPVGDYILSNRVCIERKTVSDFEKSIIDTRLFEQISRMHNSFEKPILLLEGDNAEFTLGRNVFLGTILKLYLEYNTQVILSNDARDTSYILSRFAEREQSNEKSMPRILGSKKAYSMYQRQALILSSIPGIGPKLANNLIIHFKTIKKVANANVKELKKVKKIGKKKAEKIYEIINAEFNPEVKEL